MDKNTSLVKAINKNVRTSPRKLALVCNFIKGKKADIVVYDASPLENIHNINQIHLTIKDGIVYEQ